MGTSNDSSNRNPEINDMKNVVWIDQNNNKEENPGYLNEYSEELKNFSFTLVTSVDEGYTQLKKYGFQLVFVILSGRLAEKFLDSFEKYLQEFNIITLNIIFCSNYELHKSKKYAFDPFYNPGGVVNNFKDVIKFLKKDRKYPIDNNNFIRENQIERIEQFVFLDRKIENIALPTILTKFSSRFINEEDLEKCKQFLFNNYSDELKSNNFYDLLSTKIKVPFYLYSKIFLRLYTAHSRFYRDFNISLMKDNLSDFKQIIFVLYYGLNMRIIESIYNKYLYRVSFIDLQTYEEIKKSLKSNQENDGNRNNYGASKLIITRVFSSYSSNKDTALRFLDYRIKNSKSNNLKPILYVINP